MKKTLAALVFTAAASLGIFYFSAPVAAAGCCVCVQQDTEAQGGTNYNWNEGQVFPDITNDLDSVCSVDKKNEIMLKQITPFICAIKDIARCTPPAPTMTKLEEEFKLQNVVLGVTIPGLTFSPPPAEVNAAGNIAIPWLAEYLKALYNFAVVIISIIAVVVIILQGARIITSAGGPAKGEAYKRITQAVIGLFIAWGSYVILYSINPGLTTFKPLEVEYIEQEEISVDNPDDKDPSMGGVALPASELALSKKSGPRMSKITNLPFDGGKVGKCSTIEEGAFEKFMLTEFDMKKFSDGSNGACLVSLYNSEKIVGVDFLGKQKQAHPSIVPALQKVSDMIKSSNSSIVRYWKDPGRFAMAGCYVNYSEPERYTKNCQKPNVVDSVVVLNKNKDGNRLYTTIARVMYGQSTNVNGDLHALGMACDVYAQMNLDYRGATPPRPLVTNVPKEVADAFMNNGFTWGGGDWGRDAMHFEYHNPACYSKVSPVAYPTGNGCCTVVDFSLYMGKGARAMPDYETCKNKLGGKDSTYEVCMGPQGAAGSIWIQQNMQ